MELKNVSDYEKIQRRFEAWWANELYDRPLLSTSLPAVQPVKLPDKQHDSGRDRWMDIEYQLDCFQARTEASEFLGETMPIFNPNLGPDICATAFGCELEFGEQTSWSEPVADSIGAVLDIECNLENPYWQWLRDATDASIRRSEGRWLTGLPDYHFNGDLVAALRDPQNLAFDCADDLPGVRAAIEHVNRWAPAMYDDLYARLAAAGLPSTCWTPFYHPGKAYVTSCDFICMISPAMFQEAFLPAIAGEMKFLERNVFHLDGPGALKHLDALLACEDLDALQWIYGAGNGPARNWIEVYQKTQAAGKALQIIPEDLADLRAVAEHIRPEGVWFSPYSLTHEEMTAALDFLEKWAAGKSV